MKKKIPKLSIITIVLNNRHFLEYTIQSVIEQDFKDFEFIIIDGGSTDGTLEVVEKYKSNIDVFVSEKDSGIYNAINKGIGYAKGEWLNILNSGDRLYSSKTLSQVFKGKIPESKSVLFGDWFLCPLLKNSKELRPGYANYERGELLHQSILYKRSLHKQHGLYIETKKLIISDYIFFLSLPKEYFFYLKMPISINDTTGVSNSFWSYRQKLAFDYILGRIGLLYFYYETLRILIPRVDLFLYSRMKRSIAVLSKKGSI
ncbi:glycosyltransferase [Leptospira sp. 201903075]|uniref:glycosyltransferase family 2 protein n=1 Tax=Leptospira chreensis TaxID=2810035 RepID=UPI0019629F93|nr:glycosyltransferase family 2 protein [Leptospira chreensis]MBM9590257.1 glycosyltransferase [Leptospira chreensis]